jgi:CrcB protein
VHSQLVDNSLNVKSPLFLFACVGFLGSLSTFSTFIIDLIKTFLDKKLKLCFGLAFFSVFAGLLLALLGLAFGDV